jgi:hypothetical protein
MATISTVKTLFESFNLPGMLPFQVWLLIFSFLGVRDLLNCSLVCKNFYDLSLNSDLWKMLCINENIDCGPGIEHILASCNGDKSKWWKAVYVEGKTGSLNWIKGKYKKYQIPLTESTDAITAY